MKRNPIKPRKGEKGICRVCKEEKELTKEHVPPEQQEIPVALAQIVAEDQ